MGAFDKNTQLNPGKNFDSMYNYAGEGIHAAKTQGSVTQTGGTPENYSLASRGDYLATDGDGKLAFNYQYAASSAATSTFGSPAFMNGDDAGQFQGMENAEVKMLHRFRVKFGVFANVGHHVKTVTKPNMTFAEVAVPKLNSYAYFAGRRTIEQATLELDDSLDNKVSRAVETQLQRQMNFDYQLSAASGKDYFFNMILEELSGDGSYLKGWWLDRCVVMTCDFGNLDYSDDAGLSQISLGIRYSNFTTHYLDGGLDPSIAPDSIINVNSGTKFGESSASESLGKTAYGINNGPQAPKFNKLT